MGELLRLRDTLVHRGPDAGGAWRSDDGRLALLHRRLKVIDLEGGAQPMAGRGGAVRVVYNGEIYNYRELRKELEYRGRRFETRSDTEVLVAAYEAWGPRCVERFNGIFSFALWDEEAGTLLLARDPLGVKPLYYGAWDGRFYAASEAKAIVEDPRVPREVDPEALDLFFHESYVPAPWAAWKGMRKLRAGERLVLDLRNPTDDLPQPERYYELPFGRVDAPPAREEEVLEGLDESLARAVRRQAVSDVPLGAFLSGGVDSSLLVGYLAEHSDHPIHTFSVSFEGDPNDEAPWAERVSERYGTEHHRLVVGADRLEDLERLAWSYDEPFADPAAVPTAIVSAYARERVTVALSGDGGDETHAGYPRYRRMELQRWMDHIPLGVRRVLGKPGARAFPSYRRRGALDQLMRGPADRYDAMTRQIAPHHRRRIYSPGFLEGLRDVAQGPVEGARAWRRFGEGAPGRPVVDQAQRLDLLSYLPEQLMTKLDRASMRVSLEGRVPFLDLDAVAFAATIPFHLRMRRGTPKYLLRRLLARRMGPDFVNRRKQGFTVPRSRWIGALSPSALDEVLTTGGVERWLEPEAVRRHVLEDPKGRGYLWPLLVFAHWVRAYQPTG
jgi:asparagine synthase (glutamine-hydrolysing)